ncbi:hypothetical protein QSV35_12170 [Microbacterium sp. ASV49]|uniref:CBM-cenC domain-containing protein n=1 Tax=Microbacterium candidum TaxID=3041922 RepID=A0ABT7N062_9MICO|nr:hypothetical protein [Microbacterium sp. ASV49]MDL9980089.1 hypothetical protein [Microbacterium sp. ASV49]
MVIVIAILAAITLVAFNNVTNRAKASAAASAAEQAAKKVMVYMTTNADQAPADLATAGVPDQAGTTYQYSINASASPQTYCITATTNNVSYFVNNTTQTSPIAGACPGHGANGVVPITNYFTNPSAELNTTAWVPSRGTAVWDSTTAAQGAASVKYTADGTAGGNYLSLTSTTGDIAGQTVNVGISLKSAGSADPIRARIYFRSASNAILGSTDGSVFTSNGSTWTRAIASGTAPAGTTNIVVYALFSNALAAGTVTWFDAFMVSLGSGGVPNYADGQSAGWIWNGTPNNSTSTGPAL